MRNEQSDKVPLPCAQRIADSIQRAFVKMSDDVAELLLFFDSVKILYRMYEVPDDLHAKLLSLLTC